MRFLALFLALPIWAANICQISVVGQSLAVGTCQEPFSWSGAATYQQAGWVVYSGTNYQSLQNTNLNHQPDVSPTWWVASTTPRCAALTIANPNAYDNRKLVGNGAGQTYSQDVETLGLEHPRAGMMSQWASISGFVYAADEDDAAGGQAYSVLKKGGSGPYYAQWLTNLAHSSANPPAPYSYTYCGEANVHGETDYINAITGSFLPDATAYAADLVQWQNDMAADILATTGQTAAKMFISQMNSWNPTDYRATPTTGAGTRGVPLGQLDAIRANPTKLIFVGPKYQYIYSDALHLVSTEYRLLGEKTGQAMSVEAAAPRTWTGTRLGSATISGTTITARFHVQIPPLVIDTTNLADRTVGTAGDYSICNGIEVVNGAGTTVKIATCPVTITGGDTVTIELASTPTGTPRIRVAYTASGRAGSLLSAHSNLRDSDPIVGISSGAHLYNWAATSDDPIPYSDTLYSSMLGGAAGIGGIGGIH